MFKLLSILFLIFQIFTINSNANEKIVFININYIFENSNAGKKINNQIRERTEKIEIEIKKYKSEIENEQKKILSQKNVLAVDEYNKKIIIIDDKIKQMNSEILKKKEDLGFFKNKIETNFSKKLNKIIQEYSIKNSIDIIFKREQLLMAKRELDITEDILKLFNQNFETINIE